MHKGLAMKLTNNQKLLVEKFGVLQENMGLQPAAARIVGLLLVANKPELTFEEIQEGLCLSKSAVSNALTMLLSLNKITYITQPGERKRYFKSNILQWENDVKKSLNNMGLLASLLTEIEQQRPKETKEINQNICQLVSFIQFLEKELASTICRWAESRKGK